VHREIPLHFHRCFGRISVPYHYLVFVFSSNLWVAFDVLGEALQQGYTWIGFKGFAILAVFMLIVIPNSAAMLQVFFFCFPGRRNKVVECLIIIGGSALCMIHTSIVWEIFVSDQDMVALIVALVSMAITISIYGPLEIMDIPRGFFASIRNGSGRTPDTSEHAGTDGENGSQHSIVPLGQESA